MDAVAGADRRGSCITEDGAGDLFDALGPRLSLQEVKARTAGEQDGDRIAASDTEAVVAPAQRAGCLSLLAARLEVQGVDPVLKCLCHVSNLL